MNNYIVEYLRFVENLPKRYRPVLKTVVGQSHGNPDEAMTAEMVPAEVKNLQIRDRCQRY